MAMATATVAQGAAVGRGVALPVLPPPDHLVNLSPTSGAVLAEARVSLDTLRQFKLAIQTGQIDLPSSAPDPLPPLPPIPNPSPSSYRPTNGPLASSSKSARPTARPVLSDHSTLARAHTILELVQAFNEAHAASNGPTEACKADFDQGQSALRIQWGVRRDKGAAWVFLSGADNDRVDDTSVESVKLYPEKAERTGVHDDPASVPHQQLGRHLSELDLSLPDLMDRMASIPSLIRQPCFYCQRHFKPSDGLPLSRTGYIEPPKPPRKSVEASDIPPPDLDKEGAPAVRAQGRWVCWHPSCEQPA